MTSLLKKLHPNISVVVIIDGNLNMLQKLNERLQGAIAWIVVGLIAITFTLFGVDYFMQSHQLTNVEAEVNGKSISKQAFEANYRRIRQQNDLSTMTAASDSALKKQVLEEMISNEVTIQSAHANGFEVNTAQANSVILSIPQFQEDGRFSEARYQQALSSAMFTPELFQETVKQGMLLNQQRFAFVGSEFTLPSEIERFVKLYLQTRDYDYLLIPLSLFKKNNPVSEKAIVDYYQSHQKDFLTAEKVSLDFVQLSMQSIKATIKINDDDIKRYYDENQANFQMPAQWQVAHVLFAVPRNATPQLEEQVKQKAEKAYEALKRHADQFSQLVKTQSDDKLSAMNGGVLPWLVAGQSEFDKALLGLTKVGEISQPIRSTHGYELFKLLAYKPATLKSLAQARATIREQLLTELAQAKYTQASEQLADLSYQTPDSLVSVAETLKLPIMHTALFSKEGGDSVMTKNKQVVNIAFSHDVLDLGNNSEPVQIDNDSAVVVFRVNKHYLAEQQPLAQVREHIVNQLTLAGAKQKAEQLGMQLLSGSKEAEQPIQLNQLHWNKVSKASRDKMDTANSEINVLAFNLTPNSNQEGHRLSNGDYVVVRLKKLNNGQVSGLSNEQRASIAQQIEASDGRMDYNLYLSDLMSKATIKRFPS